MPQINQYTNTATSVTDADWMDLDKSDGLGGFQSQKLSLPVLGDSLQAYYPSWGANIGNSDLQITSNRTLDANGFTLGFTNLKEFIAQATVAPSSGSASFAFIGYGNTSADVIARVSNPTTTIAEFLGDGTLKVGELIKLNGQQIQVDGSEMQLLGQSFSFTGAGGLMWQLVDLGGGSFQVAGANTVFVQENTFNELTTHNDSVLVKNVADTSPINPSAKVEIRSTSQGFLVPQMTTAQKNAISSPSNGLEVYDIDLGRKEMYHATFGWVTMSQRSVFIQARELNPLSTGNNYYFGNMPLVPSTTEANRSFLSPYNGKITGASIRSNAFGVAGDRSISVYVRINNTTDYLIQTVSSSSSNREFVNLALNTTGIPITTSDTISIKVVASGGTTDTTNIAFGGTLIIQ